ncbi:putative serine/threonine-protein kinase [Camellia lanceoleosa]|uniref:Serine/threonine-protein kinase n=1 Tax=Camellia lanceoleosa TaxID=1840588 RepID=A0ACC0FQL2_9ERIC|nr:putative serine/threonine-protein kinase [Camellia lanceoleosa]
MVVMLSLLVTQYLSQFTTQYGLRAGKSDEDKKKNRIVERPTSGNHQRRATMDGVAVNGGQATTMSRIISMPRATEGEQIVAGWPSWLTSVAGEAIQGWVPRSADSFERLKKIGQGTYSSVYKARDLKNGKIVAMKKVRFVNMDPESVRFMAREIHILRKLDHPNVMKLEGLATSRMLGSLYLVFEYMEHDLAGLSASSKINFTEPQIKCYMQQLFCGLEHCHSRGILHRDIKGSNLLIDNNGVLKVGDFGLATLFQPDQNQPLTSRVVTLWYRAPELLLGATEYGVTIDLWSAGCILAELFSGKPIMPGRTEVEQMHKIFKLCGSPSEEYWMKSKLPHATSFKPQRPYRRRVAETFKDFPSSALALIDVLLATEPEQRGTAASALKSERLQGPSNPKSINVKYNPQEDGALGFPIDPPTGLGKSGFTHSSSMVHPSAVGHFGPVRTIGCSSVNGSELMRQTSHKPQFAASNAYFKKGERMSGKESTHYVPNKSRIHCSGPLVPPGGNMEDMLKEHERQIQEAVRKARIDKTRPKKNYYYHGQ